MKYYWVRILAIDPKNISLKNNLGTVFTVLVISLFVDTLQLLEEHCFSS